MSVIVQLPWGNEGLRLTLPKEWHLTGVLTPSPRSAVSDAAEETRRSLRNPIGGGLLRHLAKGAKRVAIVIDDGSRPTPVGRLLPPVLEELAHAGVRTENVVLVTALGVHRPMHADEVERRAGATLAKGLRWENHDSGDEARLVELGTTRRGTPVFVNRTVAEADLIVSIGCIEPHLIASFGGGYKNLIPGVAGRATIAHNHALNCRPDTFNMVGRPIEDNPMRLDLEEAGAMLRQPVFIVNAILNAALEVVRVVSGDPIRAHREGAAVSASIYGVPVESPADVVIADSHPMDQDVRQGSKALANTIRAVRRGGVQIILMRAEEGMGVFGLADRKLPVGRKGLAALAPLLVRLLPHLSLSGLADDERFFLYFALQAMRHCSLIVCAPTIPAEKRASFPFAELVGTPEEAIERARRRLRAAAPNVLVFPHGGSTFPLSES